MYQLAEVNVDWLIGLAIVFSLALFLTFITTKDTQTFFGFLTIFVGFGVWAGLLDLWIMIICLLINVIIIIQNIKSRGQRF